jgi:acyl-coenzyme A synthetase/AMP-(fatty) acid ligase/acyl carrier protein
LVLADRATTLDGAALSQAIAHTGATVIQATPATWQMLIESQWAGGSNLKLLCGGEALPLSLARELLKRSGSLWNLYGPTETTVWSTISQISEDAELIPIGRPIANTQAYVLDQQLQPVPIGVVGELYIGGAGLARGYRNRPALTAEKFIPDPFGQIPGSRLYRTGDQARYLPDGTIDYLGRNDYQVKLRGFRIELGEIEAALLQHPAVHEAAVLLREDTPGDPRLVAYVTEEHTNKGAGEHSESLGAALRTHLKERLPEYMLPSAFVTLPALPRTFNGKLDRKALPAPDTSAVQTSFVAPRDQQEQQIAEIWADVLKRERIGVHDHFFELGGHSVLATRVMARIQQLFNVKLPLLKIFEHPTVAELAAVIREHSTVDQAPSLKITRRSREQHRYRADEEVHGQ